MTCELAFSATESEAVIGADFEVPELKNPYEVPVSWKSSDETVATVDQEGRVTLVGAGITIISASFEGSDDYLPAQVSYTLTVTKVDGIASTYSAKKAQVYTLTGTRLTTQGKKAIPALTPGVYLINGRKVIIK